MFEVEQEPFAQGKTKAIFAIKDNPNVVLIKSFDSLTAFNAKRRNEITGKAVIATKTTTNIFQFLNAIAEDGEFIAQRCEMIPIEWVARRVAIGSFLKRNPGVPEGYHFPTPKIETFYKDDAADDPQWSEEQILARKFEYCQGKRIIERQDIAMMRRWTSAIFRILERAWQHHAQCQLIDMKIEFGVNTKGDLLLADVIDNDSWRVWPQGDKRLQLDKQFYRDLTVVTDESLLELKRNYERVAEITAHFPDRGDVAAAVVVIVMGSIGDVEYGKRIERELNRLGVSQVQKRVCSAHKSVTELLELIAEHEDSPTVYIAIAGRSNGLGPVIAANTTHPVLNAPPLSGAEWGAQDVWSSMRMPSGVGCSTVMGAEEAALAAAKVLSHGDHWIFAKLLAEQTNNVHKIMESDKSLLPLLQE